MADRRREDPLVKAIRLARNFAEPGRFSFRKRNKYSEQEINTAVGLTDADLPKNLNPGDKIYGLAASRVPYGLQAAAFPREEMPKPDGSKSSTAYPQILDDMWSLGDSVSGGRFAPALYSDPESLRGFAKFSATRTRHSKSVTDWVAQLNASITDMRENRVDWDREYFGSKGKASLDEILGDTTADRRVVTESASARFSKLGLVQSFVRDKTVHFTLDDIDMEHVTNKDAAHYKSITSKELRFIYRKQHEHPAFKDKVKFYRGGKEVMAPWEDPDHAEAWAGYSRRSKNPAIRRAMGEHDTGEHK